MDALGDVGVLSFLATVISFVVEQIKAMVPERFKDAKGLKFERKGKPPIHLPNQMVWPLLSMLVGLAFFSALHFNLLGVGGYAGTALSGIGTGTAGGAAVFRTKSKLGALFGGTEATSAQNTGPGVQEQAKDSDPGASV